MNARVLRWVVVPVLGIAAIVLAGGLWTLARLTVGTAASLVTVILLIVVVGLGSLLGARSRQWLSNPYW